MSLKDYLAPVAVGAGYLVLRRRRRVEVIEAARSGVIDKMVDDVEEALEGSARRKGLLRMARAVRAAAKNGLAAGDITEEEYDLLIAQAESIEAKAELV